ncbi:helicase-related protein [Caulobacter sp. NIBR2454]|uniref:helicase-related protein n=1 Tax=Caulobacter sp. NIBR2454 TaxID=3015996 RepID=UPI0022B69148|nr:helicase-related protein [Caulobacter sp. NIBR2454]
MSDRPAGQAPARLVAVLGPTNTGKTHLAVERMIGHASGMIGLPLRLLAREIYDRVVKLRGKASVALITGEEKIVPPRAVYFVCTVEAMPLAREVEFLAVDEIQLCADPERGHIFTHRLLHARGKFETMLMGAGTMAPLIRRLLPDAEIVTRERLSTLTYAGSKKLTRLPRRTAVVAFSADQVYAIAELIRRQRGGAAVVMGSLSPRTRNAQVALYQSGEVDFLVATDAIGMGLNMDVDHVAFAGQRKFDGRRTRFLYPQEVAQIAGRAGRFRTDGTFGVTGDCEEFDEDIVEAVENHRFDPIDGAEWRNPALDFSSLSELLRSLSEGPKREGLTLTEPGLDERTLRRLAEDEEVVKRCKDRSVLLRLWETCQTPDFRKTTDDDHRQMVKGLFDDLTTGGRRVPKDWMAGQFKTLDRLDGEIDTLATRLASIRTLAYIANRPDWLHEPKHWQETTRALEDRVSDTLHEKLMARFIDRRTSVLMRQLGEREEMTAGVDADGSVNVQGHFVGKLTGVTFEPAKGASALEEKALRGAAQKAVAPEVARRLGVLASDGDDAFAVDASGTILWSGEAAGVVTGSRVRLLGELGPAAARERALRRLEAFLSAERGRRLAPLIKLEAALADGRLKGLARGVAHRLIEAGGVLDRREVEAELKALSVEERRELKTLGVKIAAFSIYLPKLLKPEALAFARATAPAMDWAAVPGELAVLPDPPPPPRALAARGLQAVARYAVPVEQLEALDTALRESFKPGRGLMLSDEQQKALGWSPREVDLILRALNFTSVAKAKPGQPTLWRRRAGEPAETAAQAPVVVTDSPFAALAALRAPPPAPEPLAAPAKRRPKRKPKPRAEIKAPFAEAAPATEEGATPPAKRRRRKPRPRVQSSPVAMGEGATADAPSPEASATPNPAKRRRRRRGSGGAARAAAAGEGTATEVPATAPDASSADASTSAEPARTARRRPRRRKPKAAPTPSPETVPA